MLVFGEWSVLDLAVLKAVQLNPVFNLYFLNDTECGAKRNSAYIFTFYKQFLASSRILFYFTSPARRKSEGQCDRD